MALLFGKQYENWQAYILDKFDSAIFNVIPLDAATDMPGIRISARQSNCLTEIIFYFPLEDICQVYFYHPDSPFLRASNERERKRAFILDDYYFNEENLQGMDEQLQIPLKWGWTEKATFYKNELISAELLYFDETCWRTILLETNNHWMGNAGCLIILFLWPVLLLQQLIVYIIRQLNKKHIVIKKVVIPPMLAINSSII